MQETLFLLGIKQPYNREGAKNAKKECFYTVSMNVCSTRLKMTAPRNTSTTMNTKL